MPVTADAGTLPQTGAGAGETLLPALALLAAGMLLLTRRRMVAVQ
ncbi:LPXTG-motif cell wall-anchored protein [Agrococcus sp. BE272]|nr:LPXTG-motif cell wall-anchored protein [Agrococcus sp. BE272]